MQLCPTLKASSMLYLFLKSVNVSFIFLVTPGIYTTLGCDGQCPAEGNRSIRERWEHVGESSQQGLVLQSQGCVKGAQSCRGEEATLGLCWPGQSRKGAQGIRPLTMACQNFQGGHGASRARLCTVAVSPACPPPDTLRAVAIAEETPSQSLHEPLPPALPQPSPAPSLLLSDAHQDLPVHASQHIC